MMFLVKKILNKFNKYQLNNFNNFNNKIIV